jgi:hypothetical protein
MKVTIDLTGFEKYVKLTEARKKVTNIDLLGSVKEKIKAEAIELLHDAASMSENITLTEEIVFFMDKHMGVYGGGFGQLAKQAALVNPQEILDPSISPEGTGRLLADSYTAYGMTGASKFYIDLGTTAQMQPYDDLPMKPLAYYLREGWRGKNAHMIKRPFGKLLAYGALDAHIISQHHNDILKHIGFKGV